MRIWAIIYVIVFWVSFFPAFLWYQPEHARVGTIFTILFALTTFFPWIRDHKNGWKSLLSLTIFAYGIETMGILTCFPYGCFLYSEQLWIKLFWITPLLLAFTRSPLVLWVYSYLKKYFFWPIWQSWLLWGIGLMMVDLILDPLAVLVGLWSYEWSGFWFWVPLSNFLGWIFSGTIAMMIIHFFHSKESPKQETQEKIYDRGMILTLLFFIGYGVWKFIIELV